MMASKKPARLGKCDAHTVLEKQLSISVKELIFIVVLTVMFVVFAFMAVPQTYGFL